MVAGSLKKKEKKKKKEGESEKKERGRRRRGIIEFVALTDFNTFTGNYLVNVMIEKEK